MIIPQVTGFLLKVPSMKDAVDTTSIFIADELDSDFIKGSLLNNYL